HAAVFLANCGDGISAPRELDSQRFEGARVVNYRIRTWINLERRGSDCISSSGAFSLLTALDVSGALQIRNQILLREILTGANLFRRRVDSRRARKHLSFQKIVDARREDDPVINEAADDQRCNKNCGNEDVWF